VNKTLLSLFSLCTVFFAQAQKVDSIFLNLYTDSLKKGTHNYINVDGKLSNGRWMPLTAKEIKFSASACTFSGNELIVPADFPGEKITIKVELKSDPTQVIEKTIWVKRKPDPDSLPTAEEVMRGGKSKPKRNRR
jgi:hypothetical protein